MRARALTFVLCSLGAAAACSGDLPQYGADDQSVDGAADVAPGEDGAARTDGGAGGPHADGGRADAATDAATDATAQDAADATANASDAADASDAAADPADAGADAADPPTYVHFDINHVLSTGASDSVANGASAFLTTTQPFTNLQFDTGVITAGSCDGSGCKVYQTPNAFAPLVEGDNFFAFGVETMSSGLGNQASVFASNYFAQVGLPAVAHDVLVSLHGRSGNPYWCLRLQTADVQPGYGPCYFSKANGYIAPFDEALMQVQSAKALAAAANKTYVVRAVTVIAGQGESDTNEQNFTFLHSTDGANTRLLNYTDALFDWQWDYDTKVREITGQVQPIPMFVSQFGSMTASSPPTSIIPQRQLDAHTKSGGKVNLVTPNYPFTHYTDCLHYTAHSQRRLGAYFAKAYERVVVEGKKWEPTRPLSISRVGAVITVKYVVPVPPLVIDTVRVDSSSANFTVKPLYGFIFRDSTMSASITSVVVSAPDTVTITLSDVPAGANPVLRYAYERQSTAPCPGPTNGARGNIRDSDTSLAYHTDANGNPYELFNWSVAYEIAVP